MRLAQLPQEVSITNQLRLFNNTRLLPELVINNRLQLLDSNSLAFVFTYSNKRPNGTAYSANVVGVDSILTDAQILGQLVTGTTAGELSTISRLSAAKQSAKNIPSWATWTEAQAQTWGATNIGTPLTTGRSALPATLTLATARMAIIMLLNILDQMWAMQWALARMVIAMRDKIWPDLPQP
jgi:hypothetical protein